jgi:esterase
MMSSSSLLRSAVNHRGITSSRYYSTSFLHSESIGINKNSNSNSSSSILFLHGLLGNGRNLKTFAKQVCELHQTQGHLMDLRGHGKSRISQDQTNHSFDACVQDIVHTSQTSFETHPHTLVGHSWGGRMALQYAAAATQQQQQTALKRVWLLDTVPGQAHTSVEQVIDAVDQLQRQQPPPNDRKALVQTLTNDFGLDTAISQWLGSNFRNGDFGFDLSVVQDILPEFATQDFYGLLEELLLGNDVRVDLVIGGKNKAWTNDTFAKLVSLAKQHPEKFVLHVLPKAGHWVHVDDLTGLVDLFAKHP